MEANSTNNTCSPLWYRYRQQRPFMRRIHPPPHCKCFSDKVFYVFRFSLSFYCLNCLWFGVFQNRGCHPPHLCSIVRGDRLLSLKTTNSFLLTLNWLFQCRHFFPFFISSTTSPVLFTFSLAEAFVRINAVFNTEQPRTASELINHL